MISAPSHISLINKTFSLVPLDAATFTDRDAVYVIMAYTDKGDILLIDAGESPEYGAPPFDAPEKRARWLQVAPASAILVGTHHLPTDENMREDRLCMINELRQKYQPPVG
jgi:hypothetical protein